MFFMVNTPADSSFYAISDGKPRHTFPGIARELAEIIAACLSKGSVELYEVKP
jgi:hypothetical protein